MVAMTAVYHHKRRKRLSRSLKKLQRRSPKRLQRRPLKSLNQKVSQRKPKLSLTMQLRPSLKTELSPLKKRLHSKKSSRPLLQ